MSDADKLLNLKKLLDSESITKEEFEIMKKELLNNENNLTLKSIKKNMFCRKCGNQLDYGVNFCEKCGTKVDTIEENNLDTKESNYNQNNYNNNAPNLKVLGCATIIAIFIVIYATIGILVESTNKNYERLSKEREKIAENQRLFEDYGVPYDNVEQILNSCGYSNYTIKRDEEMDNYWGDGTIAFQITYNDNILSGLTIKENSIYNVFYIDNELYKEGQVIQKISYFFLTDDEKYDYIDSAKEAVKMKLTYPDTAKFPWLYDEYFVIYTNRSDITVKGTVTASNAFNVSTTYTFEVKYIENTAVDVILY